MALKIKPSKTRGNSAMGCRVGFAFALLLCTSSVSIGGSDIDKAKSDGAPPTLVLRILDHELKDAFRFPETVKNVRPAENVTDARLIFAKYLKSHSAIRISNEREARQYSVFEHHGYFVKIFAYGEMNYLFLIIEKGSVQVFGCHFGP